MFPVAPEPEVNVRITTDVGELFVEAKVAVVPVAPQEFSERGP